MLGIASGIVALTLLVTVGLAACSGASSTAVPPTTGILIRAETLTSGLGCGRDPTQLFKYAVVVFGYAGTGDANDRTSYTTAVTSNVFDCYTDGAFISLQPQAGSSTFRLEVYAYNEPAYTAARAQIDAAGTNTTVLRDSTPTWTTECTATQQENVQALASCDVLKPGLSGLGGEARPAQITLATTRFDLPDGRVATCATAPPEEDAGADASDDAGTDHTPDAGADAGDAAVEAAAPVDAGAPITFTKVRVRPRVGATPAGPEIDVTCPAPYTAEVDGQPRRYELDVALLDAAGTLVDPGAQTVCTVTSQPGTTSSAVCR